MKELNINGIAYAKYEIENDILFLKIIKHLPLYKNESVGMMEEVYSGIISIIERQAFGKLAYLNVNVMYDSLFEEAKAFVIKQGFCSCTSLQLHFKLGYNRSGRIIDQLEEAGVISEFQGSKERAVLIKA